MRPPKTVPCFKRKLLPSAHSPLYPHYEATKTSSPKILAIQVLVSSNNSIMKSYFSLI